MLRGLLCPFYTAAMIDRRGLDCTALWFSGSREFIGTAGEDFTIYVQNYGIFIFFVRHRVITGSLLNQQSMTTFELVPMQAFRSPAFSLLGPNVGENSFFTIDAVVGNLLGGNLERPKWFVTPTTETGNRGCGCQVSMEKNDGCSSS
jgi:hypothetical protein